MHARNLRLPSLLLAALAASCSDSSAPEGEVRAAPTQSVADVPAYEEPPVEPAEPWQLELLEMAYDAASAMPIEPHVKTRSSLQEQLAVACLELEEPELALRFFEGIENWRRGSGYADYAFYLAKHDGSEEEIEHYLALAMDVAKAPPDENFQAWRRDRILVKIARTRAFLGNYAEAARLQAGVVDSELGKVDTVKASMIDEGEVAAELAFVESVVAEKNFDKIQNTLASCGELYRRFYHRPEIRQRIEDIVRSAYRTMPIMVRIDLMSRLSELAAERGDQEHAGELLVDVEETIDGNEWILRHHVPLLARLARLRWLAGDPEGALEKAAEAVALFDEHRETMADVFRPETLMPLAEAYAAMGENEKAAEIYARAVEEGTLNPNSRPRCEDLVAACVSLASHRFEPSDALRSRLAAIQGGLQQPW